MPEGVRYFVKRDAVTIPVAGSRSHSDCQPWAMRRPSLISAPVHDPTLSPGGRSACQTSSPEVRSRTRFGYGCHARTPGGRLDQSRTTMPSSVSANVKASSTRGPTAVPCQRISPSPLATQASPASAHQLAAIYSGCTIPGRRTSHSSPQADLVKEPSGNAGSQS
jgi:hypothetical protein